MGTFAGEENAVIVSMAGLLILAFTLGYMIGKNQRRGGSHS
jgi:hypothetical protein